MDESIRVWFEIIFSVVWFLTCSTIDAFSVIPRMTYRRIEDNISWLIFKYCCYTISFIIRFFWTIDSPTREERRELRDCYTKYLIFENMIESFLKVWNLLLKSFQKSFSDFSEKYSTLRYWIKKLCIFITPKLRWE